MKVDLSGSIALVTGGSGELGREMVRVLAECGADVAIHYHRNRNQAERVQKQAASMGVKAAIFQADITNGRSILKMTKAISRELGEPDIIVNNAVIQYDWKPVLEQGLFPDQSAYTAGKRGMDGVLRVLAREVGEYGVTVNQVAPGWIISENANAGHNQEDASYIAGVPLRRRGTAREVANVVAFLASDLASFITGAYIPVSGGNVMPAI